jgi:hypothetical protein
LWSAFYSFFAVEELAGDEFEMFNEYPRHQRTRMSEGPKEMNERFNQGKEHEREPAY